MFSLAVAALILGWAVPLPLASRVLIRRGCDASHLPELAASPRAVSRMRAHLPRAACASSLAVLACLARQVCPGVPAAALLVAAGAVMQCALVCDLRERILPWELCLALLAVGVAYSLVTREPAELAAALMAAAATVGLLWIACLAAARAGRPEPIGEGDLRFMAGLFALCGPEGSLYGALACAMAMGAWAAVVCVMRLLHRGGAGVGAGASTGIGTGTGTSAGAGAGIDAGAGVAAEAGAGVGVGSAGALPVAPGFCLWMLVGTLCV